MMHDRMLLTAVTSKAGWQHAPRPAVRQVPGRFEQRVRLCRQFLGKLRPNFGIIGAPLLRPKPQLAADAAQLFAAKVPPGALVVGVHIRSVQELEAAGSFRHQCDAHSPRVLAFQANATSDATQTGAAAGVLLSAFQLRS